MVNDSGVLTGGQQKTAHVSSLKGGGMQCRFCGCELSATFVNLGMSPLCEHFITGAEYNDMEPYYPLHALVCENCFLVQLKEYVTPDNIFREYAYFSSYSSSWVAHAKTYCEMIVQRRQLNSGSLVVELASNDGYLLQHFLPIAIPCLGVEPAVNVAQKAIAKGIPTITEFFGVELANLLVRQGKQADVIIGNNVLAQVPDLNDFVAGMKLLLKPEGIITLEFPHLERLIQENQFDTIYHEHFSYFSFVTINRIAQRHGLKIVDVDELTTHGGSLRVYLAHADADQPVAPSVQLLLDRERSIGLERIEFYQSFQEKVHATKHKLLQYLICAKNEGKKICGYGAPGKGNTLLNFCAIGTDFLEFTVDRNPYKHGRFTPGMRIPIFPVEAIVERKPDIILILPWNLKDEIVIQMKDIVTWGAKYVVPIPDVTEIACFGDSK
jgi:SAM-dependent methyltransferase